MFQNTIETLREQNAPTLTVHVDRPQEAKLFLRETGIHASISEGERLELSNLDFSATSEMNRRLVEAGFSVYRISEQSRSLEDIFLDFVDKEGSL